MIKAQETWESVKKYLNLYHHQAVSEKVDVETVEGRPLKDIDEALKALEIIKEKGIILQFIKETYTVEQYNAGVFGTLVMPLTKEEYDLLKEVLV